MPFKDGEQFVEDYLKKRHDDLRDGKRQTWALDEVATVPELMQKFDSEDDDNAWMAVWNTKERDINKMIGLRAKLAWVCGVRRDLRIQFACGKDEHARGSIEQTRFEALRSFWAYKCLLRFKELLKKGRKALT